MEEEDLNEDQEVDTLYETFANLATDLSSQHNALAIAAVMNAVAMSIYKTAMSQEDFEKMAELIYELRHEVQTFSPTNHNTETIH
jgi:predicted secreted protein